MLYSVTVEGAGAPVFIVAPSLTWVQTWVKARIWELGGSPKVIPTITHFGKLTNKELGAIRVGPRIVARQWGAVELSPKAARFVRESQRRPDAPPPPSAHKSPRWQRQGLW